MPKLSKSDVENPQVLNVLAKEIQGLIELYKTKPAERGILHTMHNEITDLTVFESYLHSALQILYKPNENQKDDASVSKLRQHVLDMFKQLSQLRVSVAQFPITLQKLHDEAKCLFGVERLKPTYTLANAASFFSSNELSGRAYVFLNKTNMEMDEILNTVKNNIHAKSSQAIFDKASCANMLALVESLSAAEIRFRAAEAKLYDPATPIGVDYNTKAVLAVVDLFTQVILLRTKVMQLPEIVFLTMKPPVAMLASSTIHDTAHGRPALALDNHFASLKKPPNI